MVSNQSLPITLWRIGLLHSLCVILCCVSLAAVTNQKSSSLFDLCSKSPTRIRSSCKCEILNDSEPGIGLICKNLNDTQDFLLKYEPITESNPNAIATVPTEYNQRAIEEFAGRVLEITIRDSRLYCVDVFVVFQKFPNLRRLAIVRSHLKDLSQCPSLSESVTPPSGEVVISDAEKQADVVHIMPAISQSLEKAPVDSLHTLEVLDLSGNSLSSVEKSFLDKISHLRELNLSGNSIENLEPNLFADLKSLKVLDLSANKLNCNLNPQSFRSLPSSLKFIDISSKSWTCSPKLAWLYEWSIPLTSSGILAKANTTRCRYEGSTHDALMLLVMEYYTHHVLPSCPIKDQCQCQLENIQEKIVVSTERHYTVFVSCPNKGLTHFPKLPKHTRTVDLSGNNLNNEAFELLKVAEHNYNEVENLTLNKNLLETLPENLLEMNLGISFSARNNQLTSISYDFSQRLVKTTNVIELSDNPWVCTCTSQITDLNLLAKLRDKKNMVCGPGSDQRLINKQISQLDPELLCPPDTNGESQELLLQFLCGLLSILIVVVLTKLSYDAWVYRTRGQLPWLVLKMP